MRIHFLGEFSVCGHPEILLPWERDVTTSPLYYERSNRPWAAIMKEVYYEILPQNIPMEQFDTASTQSPAQSQNGLFLTPETSTGMGTNFRRSKFKDRLGGQALFIIS